MIWDLLKSFQWLLSFKLLALTLYTGLWLLALKSWCEEVSEQEIADAKAVIGSDGIGCEPASSTTLAGIKKLAGSEISADEDIVAILTGNLLKDPDYTIN